MYYMFIYFNEKAWCCGDKQFDLDMSDFVIYSIDGIKYKDTPESYELIFKRISDDTIYTENDKLAYKIYCWQRMLIGAIIKRIIQ